MGYDDITIYVWYNFLNLCLPWKWNALWAVNPRLAVWYFVPNFTHSYNPTQRETCSEGLSTIWPKVTFLFLSASGKPSNLISHNPSVFYVSLPSWRGILGQGHSFLIICRLTNTALNYSQKGTTAFHQFPLSSLSSLTDRLWLNLSPSSRHYWLSFHRSFCLPAKETLSWKSGREGEKKWKSSEEVTEANCVQDVTMRDVHSPSAPFWKISPSLSIPRTRQWKTKGGEWTLPC